MHSSGKTLVCASLAKPKAAAPYMHNAGFEALGLDYVYVSFDPDDIGKAIESVRNLKLVGGSVSTPYKEAVLEYLDEIDSTAKAIGAVNAFKNENGRITGYNSDWIGAINALEEVVVLKDKKIAVLGAGGAARAIVFGLTKQDANVTVFNRTKDRGEMLATDMGIAFGGSLEDLAVHHPEIIINATSIGKNGEGSLQVDESVFDSAEVVMDIVTNPRRTQLLRAAEEHGLRTIEGVRMLVLQGAFTFKLITGKDAPTEAMFNAATSA